MFCCNSKDDGGSPVKKSKKAPIEVATKEKALKIVPLEAGKDTDAVKGVQENSIDQGKAEANTKINETVDEGPVEKSNVAGTGGSMDPASALKQNKPAEEQVEVKKPQEEKKDIEETLNEE